MASLACARTTPIQIERRVAVIVERADRSYGLPLARVDLDPEGLRHRSNISALNYARDILPATSRTSRQRTPLNPIAAPGGIADGANTKLAWE
jgi:hypothetical protein